MPYYSTLDNLATQIVFIPINKNQRYNTDGTVQEHARQLVYKNLVVSVYLCDL